MSLAYGLAALGLVIAALVALASAAIGVSEWLRWLHGVGTAALLVTALVTGAAAVNLVVPRGCDGGEVATVERPLLAALDGRGRCRLEGVAQVVAVPVLGIACSLVAVLLARREAGGLPEPAPATARHG